jgi:type II pantothenate kinase
MLPFARELLRQGTTVIIAANSLPSINDITAAELEALLPRVRGAHPPPEGSMRASTPGSSTWLSARHSPQICAADPVLCKGISTRQLQVVASGSGLPVIDLSKVRTPPCKRRFRGSGCLPTFLHAQLSGASRYDPCHG